MEIRHAVSDADLAAWIEVRRAVLPNERAGTVEELRRSTVDSRGVLLLAEVGGELAGSGLARPADLQGIGFVAPRVLPAFRRRGIGSALLRRLAEHVAGLGFATASAAVAHEELAAFAARFGFREVDRQVEQARSVGPEERWPGAPDGIDLVTTASRPELVRAAFESVGRQAFEDIPVGAPIVVSPDEWEAEWLAAESSLVALAGSGVVGCAGLLLDETIPTRAEHGLTAVRRDHRRRGIGTALKLATLALASERGIREVYTWTQRGNHAMQRLNERLGYSVRSQSLRLEAPLPLRERA
jgi:GNAT superfamily N-acetyltransferase